MRRPPAPSTPAAGAARGSAPPPKVRRSGPVRPTELRLRCPGLWRRRAVLALRQACSGQTRRAVAAYGRRGRCRYAPRGSRPCRSGRRSGTAPRGRAASARRARCRAGSSRPGPGRVRKASGAPGAAALVRRDDDEERIRGHRHEGLAAERVALDQVERRAAARRAGRSRRDAGAAALADELDAGEVVEALAHAAVDREARRRPPRSPRRTARRPRPSAARRRGCAASIASSPAARRSRGWRLTSL